MKSLSIVALSLVSLAFADAGANLLKPTNKVESWRFEEHEGGKGSMKADGDAMVFTITDVDGTDWHVQAVQPDLDRPPTRNMCSNSRLRPPKTAT
jgi:hypothetical protein